MSHLPTEVFERIFANLSRDELLPVRQTCARFRDIVKTCPALRSKFSLTLNWLHLRKFPDSRPPPASTITFFLAEVVDIFWWWPDFGLSITELCFESCEFTLEVLRYTRNLRSLQLKHVKLSGVIVGDFELEKVQSLSLSCANVEIIEAVGRIIKKPLVKIDFDFYKVAIETQLKMIEFVEARQDKLEDLSLIPILYIESRALQLTKPKLKRFCIRECEEFDESQLVKFIRAQPNLEDLTLERVRVSEETIRTLGQSLPKLKRLELKTFNSEMVTVHYLPINLQYLHIVGRSPNFAICNFPNLKGLHFRGLSASGLPLLPQQSPKLQDLSIECCRIDSCFQLLSITTSLKTLQSLRLVGVRWEVDNEFRCELNLNMKRLYLKSSTTMTSRAVCNLLRCYPELTEVKCYFMNCINDVVMEELCRTLPKLEKLVLMGCSTSWESARHIGQFCHALKYLEVIDCWQVEREELEQFRVTMEARGSKVVNVNRTSH